MTRDKIDVGRWLGLENLKIDMEMLKKYGPAMAVHFCLLLESYQYKDGAEKAEKNLGAGLEELELDTQEKYEGELEEINWDWPPLASLMKEPNMSTPVFADQVLNVSRM